MVSVGGAVSSANQKKVQSTLAAMASRETQGAGQVSVWGEEGEGVYASERENVCVCLGRGGGEGQ